MKRSICKRCGGAFWESYKGARGEDLCDSCEGERQESHLPSTSPSCDEANHAPVEVERIAMALCKAADDDWDWSVFYIVDATDNAETAREVYRAMARAALAAMRSDSATPSKGCAE